MSINIKEVLYKDDSDLLKLLMLADPDKAMIATYINQCALIVAESLDGAPVGVLAYQKQSAGQMELMNLGVLEEWQGQGIGKSLIKFFLTCVERTEELPLTVTVKTGDLSYQALALYKQLGFKVVSVNKDYFVTHYQEPIFENGQQLRHQVILSQVIPSK